MIVVTVTLVSAITGQAQTLGVMTIANDGTSRNAKKGSYDGQVMRKPDFKTVTRSGRIEDHPRLTETVWHLAGKMLKSMGYVK